MTNHQYQLNEGFKALLDGIFSDKEIATKLKIAFEEVVNDRATTQKINLDRLKAEALEEIGNELLTKEVFEAEMKATKEVFQSEMKATKEVFQSEMKATKEVFEAKLEAEIAKVEKEIAEVRAEIAEVRTEIAGVKSDYRSLRQEMKFYAIGLGVLIIILQPKVFDFITTFLK